MRLHWREIGSADPLLFQSKAFFIQDEIVMHCCFICNIKCTTAVMKITGFFVNFFSSTILYQDIGVLPGFICDPKIGLH